MNWSSFPFLRIALILICGIFTFGYFANYAHYISTVFYFWLIFLALYKISVKSGLAYQAKISSNFLLISIFLLGGWLIDIKHQKYKDLMIPSDGISPIVLYGVILEPLKSESRIKYLFHIDQYSYNETYKKGNNDIILTFENNDLSAANYKSGSKIILTTKLNTLKDNRNPEAFDYSKYLNTKGIFQNGFVSPNNHQKVGASVGNIFSVTSDGAVTFAKNTLKKYINDIEVLGIAEAVLLGQKMLLSEDVYRAYANTGAIHVLSVSGLHVAIFISIFIWLFSLVKHEGYFWKVFKICFLLNTVWFYVLLTGAAPSVIRAAIMVSLYILGKNIAKGTNTYNILSISAILMLIYNPEYLFQTSFQFSYISLLSILYFQPKIKSWWTPNSYFLIFVWDLINVSLAAQILIFPFTIYYFNQFPTYFAISGIIAVPLVTLIIYVGSLLIFLEYFFNSFNEFIAIVFKSLIQALNKSIQIISDWPFSVIENIWMSEMLLFLFALLIVFIILWLETRFINFFNISLSLAIIIIIVNRVEAKMVLNRKDLVVYDTFGGSLIDIINADDSKSIVLGNLSDKNINFAARNFRIKNKITANLKSFVNTEEFPHLICVDQQMVYIYESDSDIIQLRSPIFVDKLIIVNYKNHNPSFVLNKVNSECLVFDNNVKPWIIKKWLTLWDLKGKKIHQVKEDGAFVLSSY